MEDEVTSLLNEVVACEDLTLKLEVQECRYQRGTDRKDCPEIVSAGQEAFGGIEVMMDLKDQ